MLGQNPGEPPHFVERIVEWSRRDSDDVTNTLDLPINSPHNDALGAQPPGMRRIASMRFYLLFWHDN